MNLLHEVGNLIDRFYEQTRMTPNIITFSPEGYELLKEWRNKNEIFHQPEENKIELFMGMRVEIDNQSQDLFKIKYVTKRANS